MEGTRQEALKFLLSVWNKKRSGILADERKTEKMCDIISILFTVDYFRHDKPVVCPDYPWQRLCW